MSSCSRGFSTTVIIFGAEIEALVVISIHIYQGETFLSLSSESSHHEYHKPFSFPPSSPSLLSSSTWAIISFNLFAQHISFLSLTLEPHYHLLLATHPPLWSAKRRVNKVCLFGTSLFTSSLTVWLGGFKGQPCLSPALPCHQSV